MPQPIHSGANVWYNFLMSENQTSANAVSVYGQEGLDDFPVLKAFQQYIDAEQNKSRKRMVMLCVFFGFLMTVMIMVFLFILRDVSSKNDALNDRVLEFMMKSSDRQNVIVQPPAPSNDAAIKTMTDTLLTMQKHMAEQQEKAIAAQVAAAQAVAAQAQAAAQAKAAQPAPAQQAPLTPQEQRRIDSETQKLAKANAALKAEKEKLAAEKEKLRQQEIELHRRRLYPEYYEKLDRESAAPAPRTTAPAARPRPATPAAYGSAYEDEDLDDLIDDLPPIEPVARPSAKPAAAKPAAAKLTPAKPAAPAAAKPAAAKPVAAKPVETKPVEKPAAAKPVPSKPVPSKPVAAKPVEEAPKTVLGADHFNVPLEINGEASDWLIPAK